LSRTTEGGGGRGGGGQEGKKKRGCRLKLCIRNQKEERSTGEGIGGENRKRQDGCAWWSVPQHIKRGRVKKKRGKNEIREKKTQLISAGERLEKIKAAGEAPQVSKRRPS